MYDVGNILTQDGHTEGRVRPTFGEWTQYPLCQYSCARRPTPPGSTPHFFLETWYEISSDSIAMTCSLQDLDVSFLLPPRRFCENDHARKWVPVCSVVSQCYLNLCFYLVIGMCPMNAIACLAEGGWGRVCLFPFLFFLFFKENVKNMENSQFATFKKRKKTFAFYCFCRLSFLFI